MSRTSNPVSKAMSNNYNQKCDGEQFLFGGGHIWLSTCYLDFVLDVMPACRALY